MTQFLPPNLLALFAPRDPLPFKQPAEKLLTEKKRAPISGVAEYLHLFEDPKDTPAKVKVETKEERRERRRREKAELQAYKIEQGIAMWTPAENTSATTDPYKTLFVGRINHESTESKLRREFETYGPIRKVVITHKKGDGKPRGYAFVEFEKERDMHAAYKHADGKKIDGRRVLVDVERGRAVKGWLPRRLGGGLGNTRRTKAAGGAGDNETSERRASSREPSAGDRRGGAGGDRGNDRGADRRRSRSPRERPPPERIDRDRSSRDRSDRAGSDRSNLDQAGKDRERASERNDRSNDRSNTDQAGKDRERASERANRGSDRDRDGRSARAPPPRDDRTRSSRDERDRGDRGDRDGGRGGRDREVRRERDGGDASAGGNGHNGGGYP